MVVGVHGLPLHLRTCSSHSTTTLQREGVRRYAARFAWEGSLGGGEEFGIFIDVYRYYLRFVRPLSSLVASRLTKNRNERRVCLVRTRLPPLLYPHHLTSQFPDSGLCTGVASALCGLSVLIENKRRRREMALYVAPRAVYALMDEVVPRWLGRGVVGEVVSRWIERGVFAVSTGVVTTAVCPSFSDSLRRIDISSVDGLST